MIDWLWEARGCGERGEQAREGKRELEEGGSSSSSKLLCLLLGSLFLMPRLHPHPVLLLFSFNLDGMGS